MAKYERYVKGNFDEVLRLLEGAVISGSMSASLEETSDVIMGNVRMAVRAYERYSMTGSNRLSLSFTLIGDGSRMYVTAMSTGGSQAVFFKVNTLGEQSFLQTIVPAIDSVAE